jgi:ribosomal protein L16 Arg81 hydroxylase
MFKKNYIKFETQMDFNFIAEILHWNNHATVISSDSLREYVLNSIFQIRGVQKFIPFQNLYNDLNKTFNKNKLNSDLDIFFSFVSGSRSVIHRDAYDVYIIGVKGRTLYKIEEKEYMVTPGDLLYIPEQSTHVAIGLDPRIILSLGIYKR